MILHFRETGDARAELTSSWTEPRMDANGREVFKEMHVRSLHLRGQGFVPTADHIPQPFAGDGQVNGEPDFGRAGWTQAVQGAISIHGPGGRVLRSWATRSLC